MDKLDEVGNIGCERLGEDAFGVDITFEDSLITHHLPNAIVESLRAEGYSVDSDLGAVEEETAYGSFGRPQLKMNVYAID